jgi:hypothetical protein
MKEALIKRSNFYHYFGRVFLAEADKNLLDIREKFLYQKKTIFLSLKIKF